MLLYSNFSRLYGNFLFITALCKRISHDRRCTHLVSSCTAPVQKSYSANYFAILKDKISELWLCYRRKLMWQGFFLSFFSKRMLDAVCVTTQNYLLKYPVSLVLPPTLWKHTKRVFCVNMPIMNLSWLSLEILGLLMYLHLFPVKNALKSFKNLDILASIK